MANQVVLQFGSIIIALNVLITPFTNPISTHKLLISITLVYIAHLAIPTHYMSLDLHIAV